MKIKVIYLQHALDRMLERGIEKDKIDLAVINPDQIVLEEGRFVAHKKYFDKVLKKEYLYRIFFERYENKIIVVSVYKTSKINKYWKEQTNEN